MKKTLWKIISQLNKFGRKTTKLDLKYLAKSGGWRISENLIGILASFLISIAFANLLSIKDFGIYKYLLSLASISTFLTLSGLGVAVIQSVSKGYDRSLLIAIKMRLRWNFIYTLGLLSFAGYYFFKGNFLFASSLSILGIITPLTSTYHLYNSFLIGKKEFKQSAIYSFIKNILRLVVTIGVLLITDSILALIITFALVSAIPNIYFYFKIKDKFKIIDNKITKKEGASLINFGLHRSFLDALSTAVNYIDSIILFQLAGPIQLAFYTFSKNIPQVGNGLIKNTLSIYLPKIANKKLEEIRKVFFLRIIQGLVIGSFVAILLILITPYIFKFIYPQYIDSIFYAQLLSLTAIFIIPRAYVGYILNGHRMIKSIYYSSVTTNITRLILLSTLGYLFGIIGIIAAVIIGDLFGTIIAIVVLQKDMPR